MKPRTYFSLALLFPYILWVICALIAYMLSGQETSTGWDLLLMPVFFYAIGILLWFIPYTLLAIGLWLWSRNKTVKTLYRLALTAPLLLFVFMLIELALVSLPVDSITELTGELPGQAALLGGFSLVFGYLCVGVVLGIFKFLQARKLIVEETPETAVG